MPAFEHSLMRRSPGDSSSPPGPEPDCSRSEQVRQITQAMTDDLALCAPECSDRPSNRAHDVFDFRWFS
jgi:hypothetical protein